jgi:hypothetical protein
VVVFLPKWTRAFASMTLQCTLIHPGGQPCRGKIVLIRSNAAARALRMLEYDGDGVPTSYPSKALVDSLLGDNDQ